MEEPQQQTLSEIDMLKTTLCFKEHELFTLRSELERRNQECQMLALSMERLEKTTAAYYDRLMRRLDRLMPASDSRRARRRDDGDRR